MLESNFGCVRGGILASLSSSPSSDPHRSIDIQQKKKIARFFVIGRYFFARDDTLKEAYFDLHERAFTGVLFQGDSSQTFGDLFQSAQMSFY